MTATTKNWSPEQQRVLALQSGRHLVLAPPGSGKTELLAERLRLRIGSPQKHQPSLCVTFTNRAARNMIDRVGTPLPREHFVGTLHGFAFKFLRENELIEPGTTMLTEEERIDLMNQALRATRDAHAADAALCLSDPKGNEIKDSALRFYLSQFSAINSERKHNVDWKSVRSFVSRHPQLSQLDCPFLLRDAWMDDLQTFVGLGADNKSFLQDLHKNFHKLKIDQGQMDFDDALTHCAGALARNFHVPNSALKMSSYPWIQLDEVQDFNPQQWLIILLLAQGNEQLVAFGDEQQSIYSFMGAQYDMVARYQERADSVNRLQNNFRSSKSLLRQLNGYAQNAFGCTNPPMIAQIEDSDGKDAIYTHQVACHDRYSKKANPSEVEAIVQLAQAHPHRTLCVLSRTNVYAERISHALNQRRVPHTLLSSDLDIFQTRRISNAMALLGAVMQPTKTSGWAHLFYLYGVAQSHSDARDLLAKMHEVGMSPTDWLEPWSRDRQHLPSFLVDRFAECMRTCSGVVLDTETTGLDPRTEDIIQLSAVKRDKANLEEFDHFLVTTVPIPSEVTAVNHIDEAMLSQHGKPRDAMFSCFAQFLHGRHLIGHNIAFDLRMLDANLRREGMPTTDLSKETFDTLPISRLLVKRGLKPPMAKDHKLNSLLAATGIDASKFKLHNSLDDVKATEELAHKLADIAQSLASRRFELAQEIRNKMISFAEKLDAVWTFLTGLSNSPHAPVDFSRIFEEVDRLSWTIADNHEASPSFNESNLAKVLAFLSSRQVAIGQNSPLTFDDFEQFFSGELAHCNEADLLTPDTKLVISTIHKAKGLQFDEVILAGFTSNNHPANFMRPPPPRDKGFDEEEARVLYVALTRAISKVHLLSVTGQESQYMHWLDAKSPPHALEEEDDNLFG